MHVHEDRHGTGHADGGSSWDGGERGDDDLVAGLEVERDQGQAQRLGT